MAYNFKAALQGGLTPQQITNYLATMGREKEAYDYFGIVAKREGVIKEGEKVQAFLNSPWYKQLFSRQILKELPQATADVAVGMPAKFLASTGEVVEQIIKGKPEQATQRTYKAPLLSPFKSYQSEAETRAGEIVEGKKPLYSAAEPFVTVPLAALETLGLMKAVVKTPKVVQVSAPIGAPKSTVVVTPVKVDNVEEAKIVTKAMSGIRGVGGVGIDTVKTPVKVDNVEEAKIVTKAMSGIRGTVKNVLTKTKGAISTKITPMEKGVENILKGSEINKTIPKEAMVAKFAQYADQAEKALADYSQATPMELAGQEAEKALSKIINQLRSLGRTKAELTTALSDKKVGNIVKNAVSELASSLRARTGTIFTKDGLKNAAGRVSTISDKSDILLINVVKSKLNYVIKKPTFQRVDDAVDYIQDLLYKRQSNLAVPINQQVEGILKNITGKLNKSLQEIGGLEYQQLNKKYGEVIKVRNLLNKGLGADANKGAALMKQLFSPSGTMPRKLFDSVKKLTNIDLVQEATLAKYAMEQIGDVRQASLLEQVIKGGVSPKRVVKTIGEKIFNKLKNPRLKAESIIQKRKY